MIKNMNMVGFLYILFREKTVYALKQMKKWLETSGFYAHMPG